MSHTLQFFSIMGIAQALVVEEGPLHNVVPSCESNVRDEIVHFHSHPRVHGQLRYSNKYSTVCPRLDVIYPSHAKKY